ncbi:DUF1127 domain-containing protein [Azospirillum sp. sgz302134]
MAVQILPRFLPRLLVTRPLLAWFAQLWRQRRERAELLSLTDHELRDIGITRYDALAEAQKPFWKR